MTRPNRRSRTGIVRPATCSKRRVPCGQSIATSGRARRPVPRPKVIIRGPGARHRRDARVVAVEHGDAVGPSASTIRPFSAWVTSSVPNERLCSLPIEVTTARSGRPSAHSGSIWPGPSMATSKTAWRCHGPQAQQPERHEASGIGVATRRRSQAKDAQAAAAVVVLPKDPTTATIGTGVRASGGKGRRVFGAAARPSFSPQSTGADVHRRGQMP